jgi:hypothetical protein
MSSIDSKRLNVAITRAKYSLLLVGRAQTLERDELWKKLVQQARASESIVTIPEIQPSALNQLATPADAPNNIFKPDKPEDQTPVPFKLVPMAGTKTAAGNFPRAVGFGQPAPPPFPSRLAVAPRGPSPALRTATPPPAPKAAGRPITPPFPLVLGAVGPGPGAGGGVERTGFGGTGSTTTSAAGGAARILPASALGPGRGPPVLGRPMPPAAPAKFMAPGASRTFTPSPPPGAGRPPPKTILLPDDAVVRPRKRK